jgi:hypothetical protein
MSVIDTIVLPAQVAPANSAVHARVSGVVFDSLAMKPVPGALVRLVRADDPAVGRSAVTDSVGRYQHDSVPGGTWIATFLHPVLDSLHLEPGLVRLEISESGAVEMPLFVPAARTLVAMSCGAGTSIDAGVIVGEVRRIDTDAPVMGATIEVVWPEWVLAKKKVITDQRRAIATTDSAGRYRLCGAPAGSTLRSVAWSDADTSGVLEVIVPDSGFALQDFALGSVEYVTVPADPSDSLAGTVRMRRGAAVVRGRVTTTSGVALANAVVRVVGSGSQVRTTEQGEFTIPDAATGTQSIEARAIGYSPYRRTVRMSEAAPVDVVLSLAVRQVQLDTVRVVAGRDIPNVVRGIERRWRTGLGKFLDGATVQQRATLYATDALRGMPGVFVRGMDKAFGQDVFMRNNIGRECRASLFLDGMPVDAAGAGGISLDEFARPDMIAAVEVYNRPSMAPAEYLTMARNCGVVAVWTKRGTDNVPVLPPKSDRRRN